jgi:hypothetical protein
MIFGDFLVSACTTHVVSQLDVETKHVLCDPWGSYSRKEDTSWGGGVLHNTVIQYLAMHAVCINNSRKIFVMLLYIIVP